MKRALTFWAWPLLAIPVLMFYLGFGLNQFCIMHNGRQMPVRMADCQEHINAPQDDPFQEFRLSAASDPVHVCESASTRYMILGDIFVTDGGILSLGDLFMESSLWAAALSLPVWAFLFAMAVIRKRQLYLR